MKLLIQFLCLVVVGMFGHATAYDTASTNALAALAITANDITNEMFNLHGCGFTSTTEAIEDDDPIIDGSACPSADTTIAGLFMNLNQQINSVTEMLVTLSYLLIANISC